ncbi:hypothetical protein [Halorarum salinum]|uniref:Uncharacterized protein n=1 Tax=Halorarum salinum TaxID=2743089 RepID=A0A7D5LCJ2_9EURY|nr:hypothetical protein [Halobaculum salinum]QLG63288.1 hypothetical protein HUG12_16740 [Halobaculum salinum]
MVPLFGAIPGGAELLIVFLLFGVLGLLVPVGLAYWVYQDATARGNDDATLWALGTVLAGLFVFVVGALAVAGLYVLVGRE